ncbi:Bifunctional oligoribonuclease and PAP phosphatase nrnA [Weissella viridescens]|uniref:Bifunctional oligoribonuclease and PAP phosphatase nrnA n=1 Tax=Weissella viridescens TaxID=1629 RepID=A0A380P1X9_WEIVI|nr:Bifunctional oligoribonuclease and PAP phosphatase nrnA [Weissella viridescens]
MTAQTQILAQIKAANTIIIHRHQRPDPDAVGSQMGLAEIIRTTYPDKRVYVVGKQVHSLEWMGTWIRLMMQLMKMLWSS